MKTALVCDWLTGMRGGERCLEAVCELYPEADVFTLVHYPGAVSEIIETHKIHTTYIQKLPGGPKGFRRYLPLFPHAIGRFDLSGYDFVLSFNHCIAKGVKVPKGVLHICYCHTPMRYAWHIRDEYTRRMGTVKKTMVDYFLDRLKEWDKKISQDVTHFIANSVNVQKRIKDAYNRDSVVIYPPVDCDRFILSNKSDSYYLIVSALVPYKMVDLAISAFNELDRRLIIVGNGPELQILKNMARGNISFVENATDYEVVEYMRNCRALIFPGEEDFGIVPLEAQASGKPVIAYGRGGALETVIGMDQACESGSDATGMFFYEQSSDALRDAIILFEKREDRFDGQKCRNNALRFNRPVYKKAMQNYIESINKQV